MNWVTQRWDAPPLRRMFVIVGNRTETEVDRRRPGRGYIYGFPMVQRDGMQKEEG